MSMMSLPLSNRVGSPMPIIVDESAQPSILSLGLSHLRPGGNLNVAWVLSEAQNRHRAAIAARAGLRGADLTDRSGAPVSVCIRSLHVSGLTVTAHEGDSVAIDVGVPPSPETGWRSLTNFRTYGGDIVRVEMISGFRHGSDPCSADPDMLPPFATLPCSKSTARAAKLVAEGPSRWADALEQTAVAQYDVPLVPHCHLNANGMLDPDMLQTVVETALGHIEAADPGASKLNARSYFLLGDPNGVTTLQLTRLESGTVLVRCRDRKKPIAVCQDQV